MRTETVFLYAMCMQKIIFVVWALGAEPRTLNAEPVNLVYVRRPAPERPYGHLHPAPSH